MDRSVGVEEEFLLYRPYAARLAPAGDAVVHDATAHSTGQFEHELKREQAELGTEPVVTTAALTKELRTRRAELAAGADSQGVRLAALAMSPLAEDHTTLTTGDRYARMARVFGRVARVQLSCGMHVHVEVTSPDEGVGVIDRVRPWLHVLLALSANSPFAMGEDTGYASYRTIMWGSWPTSGPTEPFGDYAGYLRARQELVASGAALDEGMIYYDIRLSARYPTVELRVTDVCPYVEDVVTLAALTRALVATGAGEWERGLAAPHARTGLLRAAAWRAARFGTEELLVDTATGGLRPAWQLVDALVDHVRPALDRSDDTDLVREGLDRIRTRGTGARLQREVFRRTRDLAAVVDAIALQTTSDC